MKSTRTRRTNSAGSSLLLATLALLLTAGAARAQTSVSTYQGRLTDGGTPPNGNYDLQFALWDSAAAGTQIGATQTVSTVSVSNGIFTVTLDFGAGAFPGASRFLEISARASGAASFTLLSPRQQISSTPYAVRSLGSATADLATNATNATQLGGVAANQYVLTTENNNTFVGASANGIASITNATAIGANATVTQSNSVVLRNNASVGIGASAPKARLHVQGGDAYIFDAGKGVILKSPNGMVCKELTIDNTGAIVLNAIACP